MSEVDFESQVASEDEVGSGEKLVSVREAIRYRKRAQSAENAVVAQILSCEVDSSGEIGGVVGGWCGIVGHSHSVWKKERIGRRWTQINADG